MKIKEIIKTVPVLILAAFAISFSASANETSAAPGEQYDSTGGLYGAVEEDIPTNLYVPAPSSGELPSSVDLSKDMYFPPIGNQQGGSCVAWSTTYYQFTYEAAKLNGWNAKEDFGKVASPKFVWNYVNEGENKGVFAYD